RRRSVGVHTLLGHLRVTVQNLDVFIGHAEPIGHNLTETGLVTLTVRADPGDHFDVAGRQHTYLRMLPAAGTVIEGAQHARRGQTAHFSERRHPDTQLDGVIVFASTLLFGTQLVIPEVLQRLQIGRAHV